MTHAINNYPASYNVVLIPVTNPAAVLIAIKAARNVRAWGIYAAWKYCKNRGVALGVFKVALWCHRNERRKVERLPLFLLNQAY